MRRQADGILALADLLPDSKDADLDTDEAVDLMRQILAALRVIVAADSQSREAAGAKLDVLVRIARLLAYEKVCIHPEMSSASGHATPCLWSPVRYMPCMPCVMQW